MNNPLDRIRIVLSHTSHPGNIGAAARAMKTMGLSQLYLVNPCADPDGVGRARSSNARDVLEGAVVCASLAEALEGTVLAAAMTARMRELAPPPKWAREAAPEMMAAAAHGPVALVFGNETAGLSNEEVALCRLPVMIPTNPDYSSLNLGAAVQVMGYELRLAALDPGRPPAPENPPATAEEIRHFYEHLEAAVTQSGFLDPAHPKRLMPRLRRLFDRIDLERDEVSLLRGMLKTFMKKPGDKVD
ncbi:MAG: RNA methyltransferase [Rhodocyclaceae bacterium]|jgi:tRNA/rRNA methyltransferase|nr:RNA methyltransferase [Rhodocyclaceae bacterium]MCC6880193.1 RNA methyltransferase [Rhodocyclaceae bacterium]MCL4681084.1 RNA methyltransferase [Rhodocyclaceae bacterium]